MHERLYPEWMDNGRFNESLFCTYFLEAYPMQYIRSTLFTVDGKIDDENRLKKEIIEWIEPYMDTGLAGKASTILETMKLKCYAEPPKLKLDRISVANGTYYLGGRFSPEKEFTRNRIPVNYVPDAPAPERWLAFLRELLHEDDIPTLQEFMGYCLLPTTKAQKMLFLIGKGGEGKSRVGLILQKLFGVNMKNGSIQKVETNKFARADLENLLLMVDDDLKLEALPQTNNIKTIVTAEMPLDLERKGIQSYQGDVYARLIAFGNGTMKSLYDRTEGFFRRQLILTTKDKPKDRSDDPFLVEKLSEELESILLWCVEGLERLASNNYRFTMSERTKDNMVNAVKEGNNVVEFMESEGYFRFKADGEISTKQFYYIYEQWCGDNALHPISAKSFSDYLSSHEQEYGLEKTNNIHTPAGNRVRGYMGILPMR